MLVTSHHDHRNAVGGGQQLKTLCHCPHQKSNGLAAQQLNFCNKCIHHSQDGAADCCNFSCIVVYFSFEAKASSKPSDEHNITKVDACNGILKNVVTRYGQTESALCGISRELFIYPTYATADSACISIVAIIVSIISKTSSCFTRINGKQRKLFLMDLHPITVNFQLMLIFLI